jgi:hypothetical protein
MEGPRRGVRRELAREDLRTVHHEASTGKDRPKRVWTRPVFSREAALAHATLAERK